MYVDYIVKTPICLFDKDMPIQIGKALKYFPIP